MPAYMVCYEMVVLPLLFPAIYQQRYEILTSDLCAAMKEFQTCRNAYFRKKTSVNHHSNSLRLQNTRKLCPLAREFGLLIIRAPPLPASPPALAGVWIMDERPFDRVPHWVNSWSWTSCSEKANKTCRSHRWPARQPWKKIAGSISQVFCTRSVRLTS